MPFVPHTEEDLGQMLAAIGVESVEALFAEIPGELRAAPLNLPPPLNEMALARHLGEAAGRDAGLVCFIGAGAYDHYVPAAVWEIAGRGEFYTAYTPYQAEASQGTLQVLYEFQSMIAHLTGLEVANASLYDGASALGEAVLMAVRANRGAKAPRVLLADTVSPVHRRVVRNLVEAQGIELVTLPHEPREGGVDPLLLDGFTRGSVAALVIAQPNYFGVLEEVDALVDRAHALGALVIAEVNPISLGILRPPGSWGRSGADIVCGEGQPLGAPLSSGGPYFGFMACRGEHVRQLPGRIVGRTTDQGGREGFVLTLQAREQHIRRSRATSNICTNQGLMTVAASVYMTLLGPAGLAATARACHANALSLVERLTAVPGVERLFSRPFFHECALRSPVPVAELLPWLAERGIGGGVGLVGDYPHLGESLLTAATERRTAAEIDLFGRLLAERVGF
ncbi:MAG: aminomethyl-transferring glycine dehydrogenase subunit GcvPA [Magnetococcales bacterium]|nr:aminomethyl-transferring glycine dehydrogenase subunit GcvPA [Magnetococcales bacterium]MBF0156742.1 aminomethyl-transferring glycine dehydrogenase subunit GcvPA [Magnetococcales bacterium]